jgi:hypothetical protein
MYRERLVPELVLYPIAHEPLPTWCGRPGGYELRHSVSGKPFYVWKKPVPRIADWLLECVVYLYPSAQDADAGEAAGGTGFLAFVRSEVNRDYGVAYCVTNSHVIREAGSPVIRLNTKDGGRDVLALEQDDWIHHPDGDDLAVCLVALSNPDYYHYSVIETDMFVTKEFMERQNMGPGDEVFMVGRFGTHEGRQRNTPVVRFGNISMMPWEPIMHGRGLTVESFLVETRSLSGFSGSPVFVYHTPHTPYPSDFPDREEGIWLLGVDWGHLPIFENVKEKNRKDDVPEGWVVESNSGQMAVTPAWKLQELLDTEDLAVGRKQADDELSNRRDDSPIVLDMLPESAKQPTREDTTGDAFTRDDFYRD